MPLVRTILFLFRGIHIPRYELSSLRDFWAHPSNQFIATAFFFFFFASANLAAAENSPRPDSVTVYLFLGEECIISQYFTQQLNELHAEFSNEKLAFVGLFPNPSSKPKKITAFRQKYGLAFPLKLDPLQKKMDAFGVNVTPEAVVFNHATGEVAYQGRIDNTFFRVGKRRTVTTTSDLRDALQLLAEGKKINTPKTAAIGCVITALDGNLKNIPMCSDTN